MLAIIISFVMMNFHLKPFSLLICGISLCWLSVAISSCKKDAAIPDPTVNEQGIASTSNKGDTIEIGNPVNMIIHKYSDTITPPTSQSNSEYFLDIDGDGNPDVRVYTCMYYGISGYTNIYSAISGLNGVELGGIFKTDTLFLHTDSTVTIDTAATYSVNIHIYKTYTYQPINPGDPVYGINPNIFKLHPFSVGSLCIEKNISFSSDTMLLNKAAGGTPGSPVFGNDTVVTTHNSWSNNRYTFPLNQDHYIGFKKQENNSYKLGWIKLNCLGVTKVVILESGIQY
jgi:hypothetical protein